jgi:hypothetical protein
MRTHTRGRGSNRRSRQNLIAPVRNYYVMQFCEGMCWQVFAGPLTQYAAYQRVQRLNRFYPTGHAPFASTDRETAMERDPLGVAQHNRLAGIK